MAWTSHVKITDHFLSMLTVRPMGPEASADLWKIITGRQLHEIASNLDRGQRGALGVAGDGHVHVLIFCRDECDSAVCALLTILSEDEAHVVHRRLDTVVCSLPAPHPGRGYGAL